jgi:hypothetical protein
MGESKENVKNAHMSKEQRIQDVAQIERYWVHR